VAGDGERASFRSWRRGCINSRWSDWHLSRDIHASAFIDLRELGGAAGNEHTSGAARFGEFGAALAETVAGFVDHMGDS